MPSKLLNLFTINQELSLQRERRTRFIEKVRENRGLSDSVKTDQQPRLPDDRGPQSHNPTVLSSLACSLKIGSSRCAHVSPTIAEVAKNLERLMST